MAVTVITGNKGDGKTSLSTMFAYNAAQRGRPIFSNYHFNDFEYRYLQMSEVLNDVDMLMNSLVVVDEAYMYIDSRSFSSKANKLIGYLVLQSRKRGVDLILNLLQKSLGDLRIRENTDFIYNCTAMVVRHNQLVPATVEDIENLAVDVVLVYKADVRMRHLSRFLFDPAPYFQMYDTKEFVDITA